MARGELMKKLLASYGRDEEFRAVVEQIIADEEKKNNNVLARSLRKTLESIGGTPPTPKAGLSRLLPFPDEAKDFIQRIEPRHNAQDIMLSHENLEQFVGLIHEFRQADRLKRHGLSVRSKLLFCGPPGTGKTLCAEIFAGELGLPEPEETGSTFAENALLKAHASAQGLGIRYTAGDVIAFAHGREASYDFITCLEVVEHVTDISSFLSAISTMLKPGGLLIFSTPNRTPASWAVLIAGAERLLKLIPDGGHEWSQFVTPDELTQKLAEASLRVNEVKGLSWSPMRGFHISSDTMVNYIGTATRL